MKIYDIITENKSITENSGTLLSWIARLAAKGANRTQAVEQLAQLWASTAAAKGPGTGAKVILAGEKLAKSAGVADDIILDAKLMAQKLIGQSEATLGKAALTKVMGEHWDAVNKWTSILGVGIPITQCAWSINQAYSKQAAGDPAYQGAELSKHIQAAFDTCVGQLLALGIGRGLIKVGAAIPRGFFGSFTSQTNILEKAVMGLSTAAQTAFTAWLISPPGQKALAEYTVGNAFGASEFKYIRNLASGYVMTGYDDLMNFVGKPLPDRATTVQNRADAAAADKEFDLGIDDVPASRFNPATGSLKTLK